MTARNPLDQPPTSPPSRFDNLVASAIDYWRVPGLAVAIIDRTKISCQGYGIARFSDGTANTSDEKVTPQTLFDIASCSKSFTAAAMALLVEDEKIEVDWDTPMSKLLPGEFVLHDQDATKAVSVGDCLSHRSGLPGHDGSVLTTDTPRSLTLNLRNLPPTKPLRTTFQYSNQLYSVSSYAIERLSGTQFADFLSARLWQPLQMTRTYLGPLAIPAHERKSLAQGYIYRASEQSYEPLPAKDVPEDIGPAKIQTSVEDLARWVSAFIHSSAPLRPESYISLTTPRIYEYNPSMPYLSPIFVSLGWEVCYYRGRTIVKHAGLISAFSGIMLYVPEEEWGVVMLGNSNGAENAGWELAWWLVDEVLGVEAEQRYNWRKWYKEQEEKEDAEVQTMEDMYPELKYRAGDESFKPNLENFEGVYENVGYHSMHFKFDREKGCLEADCTDRSSAFSIVIRQHAYEYWYVAERFHTPLEIVWTMKCRFRVSGEGVCEAVGLAMCWDMGEGEELIWFERAG